MESSALNIKASEGGLYIYVCVVIMWRRYVESSALNIKASEGGLYMCVVIIVFSIGVSNKLFVYD